MPSIADLCGARKQGGASLAPIRYLGFFLPEIPIPPGSLTGCHYRGIDDWRPRVLFFLKGTLGSPERTGPDILWRLPGNFIRFG
jgi:hypothetical protein